MMYLVRMEWKKLFCQKNLLIFFGVCTVLWFAYLTGTLYGMWDAGTYSSAAYQNITDFVQNRTVKEAKKQLEQKAESFSRDTMYTDNLYAEEKLYEEIFQEIDHVMGYQDYVNSVVENAQKNGSLLIRESAYAKRCKEKTAEDFQKLQQVKTVFTAGKGATAFCQFDMTDGIVLLGILFCAAVFVSTEKEEGTLSLLSATASGRKSLGIFKWLAGMGTVTVLAGILFFVKALILWNTYGPGDLNAPVQSLSAYASCKYLMTVKEFAAWVCAGKLCGFYFFFSLLFWLAGRMQKPVGLYTSVSAFLGVELLCWLLISEHSWLYWLKEMNLFSFLESDQVLGVCRYVNVLGRPVDYALFVVCLEFFCFCLFSGFGVRNFERTVNTAGEHGVSLLLQAWKAQLGARWEKRCVRKSISGRQKKQGRIGRWRLSGSLFLLEKEIKKAWIGERGIVLFLAGVMLLLCLDAPVQECFSDKDEVYYKKYVQSAEGKYTKEKADALLAEQKRLDKLEMQLNSGEKHTELWRKKIKNELEKRTGLEEAMRYVQTVKEKHMTYIVYDRGYLVLAGLEEGADRMFLLRIAAVVLMAGMAVLVWGVEERSQMKQVLHSTTSGIKKVYRGKKIHLAMLAALIWALAFLPWIRNVLSTYSCTMWHAGIASIGCFQNSILGKCRLDVAFIVFYLLHFVYLYAVGRSMQWFQEKLHGSIMTVFAAVFVFLIPVIMLSKF